MGVKRTQHIEPQAEQQPEPQAESPQIQTFILSDALIARLRPLVDELGKQEKEAQRMKFLADLIQEQIRLLISRDIGVDFNQSTDVHLDIARGLVRLPA